MDKRWLVTYLAGVLVLLAGSSMADTAFPYVDWISPANTVEASLFVLPDGSGPALSEAYQYAGQNIDATITLGLVTCWGDPIQGFPLEDIWLESEDDGLGVCNSGNVWGFSPDGSSDINGEVTFSSSLAGGGWNEGPLWVYVVGGRALSPIDCPWGVLQSPVPLRINSADINGDGQVDLIDISLFSSDFFGSIPHYRSDFRWDGVLDLSDVALMASGVGKECN